MYIYTHIYIQEAPKAMPAEVARAIAMRHAVAPMTIAQEDFHGFLFF